MTHTVARLTPARYIPPHNLQGHHGPRCPACSGLGRVLRHVPSGPARTTHTSICTCGGSGIGRDTHADIDAFVRRMETLDREALASAARLSRLSSLYTLPPVLNSRQMWSELLAWATADGTAVHTTTTETIIFPNITIPGNYMQDGRVLRLRAYGKLSTTGTPTMTFAIRWGGVAGTLLATTEAITCASGAANTAWSIEAFLQTRANGSAGSVLAFGDVVVNLTASTQTSGVFGVSGFDAPAAVTVDLTADTALSLTCDWSASSASNTLTGMFYTVEAMN